MPLHDRVRFTAMQFGATLPGRYIRIRGELGGDPAPERNFLYEVADTTVLINGVPQLYPGMYVGLFSTLPLNLEEGSTIRCESSCAVVGAVHYVYQNVWQPFYADNHLSGTITIPLGVDTTALYLLIQQLEGVNTMAGKLGKFTYTTDGNTQYTVVMDDSNGRAVGNVAADPSAVANKPGALTMRYILLEAVGDPTLRRKIPISQPNNGNYINGGNIQLETVTGPKTFKVTGRVGEKFSF